LLFLGALPCLAATFGTVVPHAQPLADLVIDEARRRLYVVNTASNQIEVYATNVSPPRQTNIIKTEATPLAVALSRPTGPTGIPATSTTAASSRYLYVVCYDASSLDIIDLTTSTFTTRSVTLAAKPQGLAVGVNDKVLISTIGTGTGADILITYDPTVDASKALSTVTVAPPAPVAPTLPPPNGIMAYASKARLQATNDGTYIIGVHMQAATRAVWVFDVVASTVLASRTVAGVSSALAVSPDNSHFLSGPFLFETSTLLVQAQHNTANAPYTFPVGANFNNQTSQGGAVFTPDGSSLLAAYNIVPVLNPAAKTNTAQMMINTPDTLLVQTGIMLPENLGGKMAITSDSATAYAISQSGFIVLPIGTLRNQPIAVPDSNVALLASDQCGVTAAINSAVIPVRDIGGGRTTITAQVLANQSTSTTVTASSKTYGADVTARFNANAARTLGTSAADQVLLQSSEAINILPTVRVFQNNRNAEARGAILPIDTGASTTGLADMLQDAARQRLYIANPGLNRLEVFDMQKKTFLAPIAVGQLPRSMAFGNDGNTLYVASGGSENITIVDLTQGKATGRVRYPALPFNSTSAVLTPSVMASSQRGVQIIMSDSTLWHIVGDSVIPRTLNTNIFGTARSLTAPQSMASTPEGAYVLILAGNGTAYLYSSSDDDFVSARSVIPTPIQGYFGPIAAGPNGQYYLVNDQVLNQALTPVSSTSTGPVGGGGLPTPGGPTAGGRPVSAVTAVGGQTFARYSTPVTAGNAAPTDAGLVELVDVTTFQTRASNAGLEGPSAIARAGQRLNILGRAMAVDATGTTAFVLTESGLSLIPLDTTTTATPTVSNNGVVNAANFLPSIATNGLVAIIGRNLASTASAPTGATLPTVLGGTCVTLNNTPIPLLATSAGQINAQIPTTLAAGRFPLIVRNIAGQAASSSVTVTVAKYAPAIFMDANGPQIYHADGSRVTVDHPGHRDEKLTIYTTGMGTTTGGRVTTGAPSPASPLAVTGPVNLYFGNPLIKEAGIIVNWSGLVPGMIGVYQITATIPGAHINGNTLPVTVKIGGVSSPTTGPNVPTIAVQ
jgi:uncharacterized protein (TIGR03437 family)